MLLMANLMLVYAGLNEVLAPFIMIHAPDYNQARLYVLTGRDMLVCSGPIHHQPQGAVFNCFYSFVNKVRLECATKNQLPCPL